MKKVTKSKNKKSKPAKPIVNEFLKIRNSKIHGSGGFAKKDLKKGQRIIEYIGEKISNKESEKISRKNGVYIFELDKKWDIDGNVPENIAKYINHSCEPNCNFEIRNGHIWIKAKREIKKGEELFYNYGFDFEDHKDHLCKCGTKSCVGFILAKEHWKKIK